MCYTYDKSKGGDTRELQSRIVPPKKTGSSHLKCASYVISSKGITIGIFYPIRPCNESLNECKLTVNE